MTNGRSELVDAGSYPVVSVVIPFGRGVEFLRVQLEALFSQDFPGLIEILVACNVKLLESGTLDLPMIPDNISLVLLDATASPGPSYARNVGWSNASARIVLFCDADDKVDRLWISAMTRAVATAPIVGGRLSYAELNDPDHASWNSQTTKSLPRKFKHLEFVPSSNLGVRKEVLETLRGFDESLSCGEDIDFCWRAQYADFRLVFAPDAVVEYRLRSDLLGLWRQSLSYGASDAPLLAKHALFGAKRPFEETVEESAAIFLALMVSFFRPRRFKKFVVRLGMFTGRVVGSLLHKRWAV